VGHARWAYFFGPGSEPGLLESVVRIEFDPRTADTVLSGHEGTTVDYAVNLWWRRF
jgi:hypothetical protein